MIWGIAFNIALLLGCAYAAVYGGRTERIGAALLFSAATITTIVVIGQASYHRSFEAAIFAIDVAMLAALLALSLTSDRYWPLWATGFHVIGVATHAAILTGAPVAPLAYAHGLGLWSYLTLFALVWGTRAVRRETLRGGA
jgi:hypothetical protein